MKFDLTTSIIAAVIGVAVAFFVSNLLIPGLSPTQFKTISGSTSYGLTEPNSEVFNFRALNPTVEVYVGNGEQ